MILALGAVFAALLAVVQPAHTATSIPLDAPWKVTISISHQVPSPGLGMAALRAQLPHRLGTGAGRRPARRYRRALRRGLPARHGGLHAVPECETRARRVCGAAERRNLSSGRVPDEKLPAVQAAERGHMYYSDPGTQPEAIVLHDADSLDFLGRSRRPMISSNRRRRRELRSRGQDAAHLRARHPAATHHEDGARDGRAARRRNSNGSSMRSTPRPSTARRCSAEPPFE